MRLALAALVASTGCAQIAGIDETSGSGGNADLASVQVQRVSIGASVAKSPQDLSGQSATFYDDSASTLAPVPGVLAAPDTFTADVAGTPSVIVTLPEDDTVIPRRLYATPAREQKVNFSVLEHAGAQPPPPNAALDLNVTLPTAYVSGETFSVEAIGPWTGTLLGAELPAADTGATTIDPAPIPYKALTSTVGGTPSAITMSDVVLVLRYNVSRLTGVFQTQFDQTDGPDPVAGAMTEVPATNTLTATIAPATYQTRFSSVRPNLGTQALSWRVVAAPGWSVADATGVRLGSGAVDPAETTITAMYGNPFESLTWKAVFTVSTVASRAYTYSDGTMSAGTALYASMSSVAEPSTTLDITMPAGLAVTVTANATPLVTDGQTLALDLTQPVTIDATVDKSTSSAYGPSDIGFGFETTGPTPVVTKTTILDALTAGTTEFRVPPELFTAGRTYYVQYRTYVGGFTGAASGDLQTISLPYSTSTVDSAVFTVGMP